MPHQSLYPGTSQFSQQRTYFFQAFETKMLLKAFQAHRHAVPIYPTLVNSDLSDREGEKNEFFYPGMQFQKQK
jgi:hypothetical protein